MRDVAPLQIPGHRTLRWAIASRPATKSGSSQRARHAEARVVGHRRTCRHPGDQVPRPGPFALVPRSVFCDATIRRRGREGQGRNSGRAPPGSRLHPREETIGREGQGRDSGRAPRGPGPRHHPPSHPARRRGIGDGRHVVRDPATRGRRRIERSRGTLAVVRGGAGRPRASSGRWRSASVPSHRQVVNPVRPGREQRQRRTRVPGCGWCGSPPSRPRRAGRRRAGRPRTANSGAATNFPGGCRFRFNRSRV